MPDLQKSYPAVEGCYYRVVLTGDRTIERFRSGEWQLERFQKAEVLRLRMLYPASDPRGNAGFDPREIVSVTLICPPVVDPDPLPIPGPFSSGLHTTTTDPPVPQPQTCTDGEIWQGRTTTEVSNYVFDRMEEDSPLIADAVWAYLEDYVPSAGFVKCWMFVTYKQTTTSTTERLKCENNAWVEMDDLVVVEVETVRLRLHIGGNPCQDWRQWNPPPEISDISGHTSWGWVYETTTTSTTTGN